MSNNRHEYFGSVAGAIRLNDDNGTIKSMFNEDGYSISEGNPYSTLKEFYISLGNATKFQYDHFLNNVMLSSWIAVNDPSVLVNIDIDADVFWHDPVNDTWIMTADNIVYHVFK